MSTAIDIHLHALQKFEPAPDALYPIDSAARLAGVPRHLVLVCCKHGLIAPSVDPEYGSLLFDAGAIHTLQRVGYLHQECGINLAGIQMILHLMDEVERLRAGTAYTDWF